MKTLSEYFKQDSAYWGERSEWLVAYTTHRDADCLTRSNWRVLLARLGGGSDRVVIERASHWACGWVDRMLIRPNAAKQRAIAKKALADLENYPVLDEDDFSGEEANEANEIWSNCYGPSERVKYIREHRSQFEFYDFANLLECVRGRYFSGYPSELIY